MAFFGSLIPSAQWFVDSVGGSDSNNGTSETTPLLTIAALLAKSIQSNDLIALKCGSVWKEKLVVPTNNVHVCSYGSGAQPILDSSDVIGAGGWSKTGGQTSVYQAPLTCEASSGPGWVSAWENSTRLVRASSIANCDATAGSYFPSSDISNSFTLYLHASDGSNPGSNGKTYEYAPRYCGYDAVQNGVTGCRVIGIQTKRNFANNGSLLIGKGGFAFNCLATEGTKHNVYMRTGGTCYMVTAQDAYFGGQSFILFVGNENIPNNEGLSFIQCTATLSAYDSNASGFYTHTNTSGSFGVLTFDTCTANNCAIGISGNAAASGILRNCGVTNSNISYSCDHDWVLTGCAGQANQGGNSQVLFIGSHTVEVSGFTGSTTNYWIWIGTGSSLYVHDCDWSATALGAIMIELRGPNAGIKARNIAFNNTSSLPYTVPPSAVSGMSIDSDFNTFSAHGALNYVGQINGVYSSFAQWQGLGYDTHSTAA